MMQAATPQIAKKAKDVPARSAGMTGKMEEQLKLATEVLGKMVSEMNGEVAPPYIRDRQKQLVNMSENMKQLEKINEDLHYKLRDLECLQRVPTKRCTDNSNRQRHYRRR